MIRFVPRRSIVLLSLLAASVVRADDPPVLHEFVPEAGSEDVTSMVSSASEEPAAILYDGELLAAPEGGERRSDERAMVAPPGDGSGREAPGRRSPTFRPDRVTSLEETLGYYEVFTPAVAPFKRVTSLDTIARIEDGTPVLGVGDDRLVILPVEGADSAPPDSRPRDRFWGSVIADFRSGTRVPFPSVSPESRILTLRTEPETPVKIERDGSGNFFASTPHVTGEVRVVFLTDAPRWFFNAPAIPDVASDVLEDEVFPMDVALKRDALQFAREIGVRAGDSLPDVLDALTAHFRAFEESSEPPADTGNIFLDLARGQRGVCRHRAYGFLITAQALGVPTRFVHNEAHAWVEVKMVEVGWMRIDLGGAASGLEAHGADDRPVHRPAHPDPLPRPESYQRSYSRLGDANTTGLRSGEGAAVSEANQAVVGTQDPPSSEEPAAFAEGGETSADVNAIFSEAEGSRPRPLRLALDRQGYEAFRGRALTITGRALDPDGSGVAGLRVDVLSRRGGERLLGVTVTREDGTFQAAVGVPPDLEVGGYELVVRSPGNARFFPATAR